MISFSQGIIHEYYTVALAPAIGALVGIGSLALWAHRTQWWARVTGAGLIAGSAWWAAILLGRSADFAGWLIPLVLVTGLAAAGAFLVAPMLRGPMGQRVALGAGIVGLVVALAGPLAYSVETATSPASGSLPSAGPTVAGASTGPGGRGPGGAGRPGGGGQLPGATGNQGTTGTPGGTLPGGTLPGGTGGQAGTLPGGPGGTLPGGAGSQGATGQALPGFPGGQGGPGTGGGGRGGPGSLLEASTPSAELTAALVADAEQFTWVAAAVGANAAAGYQLASEEPVMAIGGFNGSDPSPTLAQFQALVAAGQIHWFLGGGDGFGTQMGGSQSAAEISAWVESNFPATTIDGTTLYDLSASDLAAQAPEAAAAASVAL